MEARLQVNFKEREITVTVDGQEVEAVLGMLTPLSMRVIEQWKDESGRHWAEYKDMRDTRERASSDLKTLLAAIVDGINVK